MGMGDNFIKGAVKERRSTASRYVPGNRMSRRRSAIGQQSWPSSWRGLKDVVLMEDERKWSEFGTLVQNIYVKLRR